MPGGSATMLHLPLDPAKELASMKVEAELYGVVLGLMAATLVRGSGYARWQACGARKGRLWRE